MDYETDDDAMSRLSTQNASMKNALAQIATMTAPDDIETDYEGQTEWGVQKTEVVEMAYENCIAFRPNYTIGDVISS